MKTMLASALVLLLFAAGAHAYDVVIMEQQAHRLQSQIELQIEQIRRAREVADHRVNQRLAHLEAQLKLSEEDLERRVEELKGLQRNLREQLEGTDSGIAEVRNELKRTLQAFYSDVQAQIQQTNTLINRVKDIRRGVTRIQDHGLQGPDLQPRPDMDNGTPESSFSNGAAQNEISGSAFGCSQGSADEGTSPSEIDKRLAELQDGGSSEESATSAQPGDTQEPGG